MLQVQGDAIKLFIYRSGKKIEVYLFRFIVNIANCAVNDRMLIFIYEINNHLKETLQILIIKRKICQIVF